MDFYAFNSFHACSMIMVMILVNWVDRKNQIKEDHNFICSPNIGRSLHFKFRTILCYYLKRRKKSSKRILDRDEPLILANNKKKSNFFLSFVHKTLSFARSPS